MYKAIVFVTDHQNRMYKVKQSWKIHNFWQRYCLKCSYSSGETTVCTCNRRPSVLVHHLAIGSRKKPLLFWCSGDASLLSFSLETVCSLDSSKGVAHLCFKPVHVYMKQTWTFEHYILYIIIVALHTRITGILLHDIYIVNVHAGSTCTCNILSNFHSSIPWHKRWQRVHSRVFSMEKSCSWLHAWRLQNGSCPQIHSQMVYWIAALVSHGLSLGFIRCAVWWWFNVLTNYTI